MTRRIWRKIAGAVAMILMAFTLTPATAIAQPEQLCPIWRGAHYGEKQCDLAPDWKELNILWPDGRLETFVVGKGGVIYHIWQNFKDDNVWSGWHSMGGIATAGVFKGGYVNGLIQIMVRGTDYRYYCKHFYPPQNWTDWYVQGCPAGGQPAKADETAAPIPATVS